VRGTTAGLMWKIAVNVSQVTTGQEKVVCTMFLMYPARCSESKLG